MERLKEEYPEYSNDTLYAMAYDIARNDLNTFISMNNRKGRFFLVGQVNTWNEHITGFDILAAKDFEDCIEEIIDCFSYGDIEICVEDGNITVKVMHHDGTHYFTLYQARKNAENWITENSEIKSARPYIKKINAVA